MRVQELSVATKWGLLTPKIAKQLLKISIREQRQIRQNHVRNLSKLHIDGKLDGRSINIVTGVIVNDLTDEGLVNGHHTCWTVAETEKPLQCNFQVAKCSDVKDRIRLYSVYDNQLRRNILDAMVALGISTDITHGQSIALGKAAVIIEGNFLGSTGRGAKAEHRPSPLYDDAELARSWLPECSQFYKIASLAPQVIASRKWLGNGNILAVAVTTLRTEPELAEKFWTKLATGERLGAHDPIKITRDYMMSQSAKKQRVKLHGIEKTIIVQRAWNSFFEGVKLPGDRVTYDKRAMFEIAGTGIKRDEPKPRQQSVPAVA